MKFKSKLAEDDEELSKVTHDEQEMMDKIDMSMRDFEDEKIPQLSLNEQWAYYNHLLDTITENP